MSFETPDEVFTRLRLITLEIAQEVEARVSLHLDRTYRNGWADGYLARLHEEDKES